MIISLNKEVKEIDKILLHTPIWLNHQSQIQK